MRIRLTMTALGLSILMSSCVAKKKYVALEEDYNNTRSELAKTQVEKEEIEAKYAAIEERVEDYNSKINSLKDLNSEMAEQNDNLLVVTENGSVISNATKKKMREVLRNANQEELANAQTLEDSMNIAVSYNLKKDLDQDLASDDVQIDINETVVMISISDKLLFNSGSARVSSKANDLLQRIAEVVNSEPAIEIMVEGHTDDQKVKEGAYVRDNWELSVERSTAIIRKLQDKYNVDPAKMIAAGRSSYKPLVENDSRDNRAINRRTRIVILPNLDKFLSMITAN